MINFFICKYICSTFVISLLNLFQQWITSNSQLTSNNLFKYRRCLKNFFRKARELYYEVEHGIISLYSYFAINQRHYFKKMYFYKSSIYNIIIPVDTGRKLNVHKTFRRRLGRLLNVLCTFNLRPVSTRRIIIFFF